MNDKNQEVEAVAIAGNRIISTGTDSEVLKLKGKNTTVVDGQEVISNKMDWVTVAIYAAIVFMGWLNIYAVTYDPESDLSIFNLS